MNRRQLLLASLGLSLSAHAQEPPQVVPVPRNLTPEQQRRWEAFQLLNRPLGQHLKALPEAQQPRNGLWLIVGSQLPPRRVTEFYQGKSQGMSEEQLRTSLDVTTLEGITRTFGRRRVRFGRVVALVPETMTVLHADPRLGESVPLGELISTDPLTALLATLSDPQFDQLVSRGLGFGDLSPDQASLLKKALPKPFKVAPVSASEGTIDYREFQAASTPEQRQALQDRAKAQRDAYEKQLRTVPERELVSGLRLRVFQSRHYTFGVPGQQGFGVAITPTSEKSPEGFRLENDGREFGMPNEASPLTRFLRSELPNQPKPSELALSVPALSRSVRLSAPKTVAELVGQLAQATGLELFCSPRLAGQGVLLLGESDLSVPARELFSALSLAVCGTWRRVGSGYVLTYSTEGYAPLRARQAQIVKRWEARAKAAGKSNTKRLKKRSWTTALPFVPGDPSALPAELLGKSKLPFSELPTALRQAIRADLERSATPREPLPGLAEQNELQNDHLPYAKVLSSLKDSSSVGLDANLQFGVELAGVGVMRLGQWRWLDSDSEPAPPTSETPIPPVQLIPIPEAFRGVLAATDRPAEAAVLVQRTKALGFNALLLAATPQGAPYFTLGDPTKVLSAAIAEGKKQGVAVWAVVDVLSWRRDRLQPKPAPLPPGIVEDRGLFGETNSEGVLAGISRRNEEPGWVQDYLKRLLGNDGFVSPFAPAVAAHLKSLVTALARLPDLAGIAFQRSAPPGYQDMDYYAGIDYLELGYLPEARQLRLRAGLGDPLDETNNRMENLYFSVGNRYENLKLDVPEFAPTPLGVDTWQKARAKATVELLQGLFQSVRRTAPELPLLLRERKFDLTFEPWVEAGRLNEMKNLDASADAMGQRASEKTVVVARVSPSALRDWRKLKAEIESERSQHGRGKSKSLVLDLLTENPAVDCRAALESIAPYLSAS